MAGGDIGLLSKSFRRSLEAANRSPATIRIYTISVAQLADFLHAAGMPLLHDHQRVGGVVTNVHD